MPPPSPQLPDLRDPRTRERLGAYLRNEWAGDAVISSLSRADGGFSNETWLLDISHDSHSGLDIDRVVLRRQAIVGPLEPYDLKREATILSALGTASDVPVPQVHRFCGDAEILGSPFTIVQRVEGDVPDYRTLPEYHPWTDPDNRRKMAREVICELGAIQRVTWQKEPFTSVLGEPREVPPVVGRVQSWIKKLDRRLGGGNALPVLHDSAAWLIENAPASAEGWVLVHGDFRVGNFIWNELKITAVLDWEGAGIGDPFEDLGYLCHPMARVRDPRLMGMLVPFDELAGFFESEMGREVDTRRVHYYVIYALFFHLATLVSGLVSALDGADLRAALGYSKFGRVTRELICHMYAYEDGSHVL